MSKSTNSINYEVIELPIEVKKKWGYKAYKVGDRRLGFRSKWRRNVIRCDRLAYLRWLSLEKVIYV